MSDELCFLSVADAARRLRDRSLSPVELTEAYLDRIAAIDGQLNAYITVTADLARRQARAAEASSRAAPTGVRCMASRSASRT